MPVDPSTIPDLTGWWKADAITGLTDGLAVGSWPDSSGAGRDATQATAANKPLYKTAILNGLPVVRFDGVNDRLAVSVLTGLLNAVPGATILAVVKTNAAGTNQHVIDISNATAVSSTRLRPNISSSPANTYGLGGRRLDADAAQFVSGGVTNTNWHLLTARADYANALASVYLDGVLLTGPSAFETAGVTSATDPLAAIIGAAGGQGTGFWNGDIAELLIYQRALTAAELLAVHTYLGQKYAIAGPVGITPAASGVTATASGAITAATKISPAAASLTAGGSAAFTARSNISGTAGLSVGASAGLTAPTRIVPTAAGLTAGAAASFTAPTRVVPAPASLSVGGSGLVTAAQRIQPAAAAASFGAAGQVTAPAKITGASAITFSGSGEVKGPSQIAGSAAATFTGAADFIVQAYILPAPAGLVVGGSATIGAFGRPRSGPAFGAPRIGRVATAGRGTVRA